MLVILALFLEGKEHFTFQSNWMKEQLLSRNENNQVYQGGLISDVTYCFFESGYLMTASMFCEPIARWIPVQLTWIRELGTPYYKIHFKTLFQQFLVPELTHVERLLLARQVVDFSLAQRNGFIKAFMEVFGITDRDSVFKSLKGCHQHFRAQVTRV
jgi:hypothetical protein